MASNMNVTDKNVGKMNDNEVMKALEEKVKKLEDDYKRLQAKAEAYKEFAERLKEKQVYNYEWECMLVDVDDINNLLKELVGDK